MRVLYYHNSISEANDADNAIFLAGPTVRSHQTHLTSWRDEALKLLEKHGFDGTVFVPEFADGVRSDNYDDVVQWEYDGLLSSAAIVFWIPRTEELLGLTTNVEFGFWLGYDDEVMVYGRPDNAYRVRYLDKMWQLRVGTPIHNTLEDTILAAINKAGA